MRFRVQGMTCGHCEQAVEKAVAGVPGVEQVITVDRAQELVEVTGRPDPGAVIVAIAEEGYRAEVA